MSESFLNKLNEEIQRHALIVSDNSRALQEVLKRIVSENKYCAETDILQTRALDKFKEEQIKHVKTKLNSNEITSKLSLLRRQIQEKERTIRDLENKLKNQNEKYENYKLEQDKLHRNNKTVLNALQKAIKQFTQHFQYTIHNAHLDDSTKYCVVVNFVIKRKESTYPIKFIFDRNTDSLLEFDASALLNEEEHESLVNCYKQSQNNIALLCTLRNLVLAKDIL
ncbi:hypothetical protein RN001_008062 [Aquatica leii]|uniref:Kinetochore protein SPC25 n=1 Tax=Aquatica leii TaxID=1421715 RepID=A0AAN7S9E9_9COLE|nr:hypothetical protein RN001_008062 [Aquatica leii]